MVQRRKTRQVKVGDLYIGGNAPISVQTMYDIPLCKLGEDFEKRMRTLKSMGCDIVRFSYPNINEHENLYKVTSLCPMPVVADIHFDWKSAMDAMDCNVSKIRINPANIGAKWKTQEIVKKAKDKEIAIRIGLNAGSLPNTEQNIETRNSVNTNIKMLMVNTALEYISWFEELGFYNTVVSLKASDVNTSLEAAKEFAQKSDYPLHLGVTEAGSVVSSCVRTTWALGNLLSNGIGDTIRYSITGSIEDEVYAGVELLRTLGLRKKGIRIVSCPMCGRKSFDTQKFLKEIEPSLLSFDKDLTVAIMGCQVNGPGEAKNANIAISGIGNKVYMYKNGVLYKELDAQDAKKEFLLAITEY